jgi:hypothetical protein
MEVHTSNGLTKCRAHSPRRSFARPPPENLDNRHLYSELLQPDDSLRESGRHRHHEPGARHPGQYPECKCAELRSRPKDAVDNNRSLRDKTNCGVMLFSSKPSICASNGRSCRLRKPEFRVERGHPASLARNLDRVPQVVSKANSSFLKFATPEAVERSSNSFHATTRGFGPAIRTKQKDQTYGQEN